MVKYVERTVGKIRDLPVSASLKRILITAAELSNIDRIEVISGGQCARGTCSKRTGSTRHDNGNAADLQLIVDGARANHATSAGENVFADFAKYCAALGATGIGAGPGYMDSYTMHVGFGSKSIWGAGGRSSNAPHWLKKSVQEGWREPLDLDRLDAEEFNDSPTGLLGEYQVAARNGLNLRGGPGTDFEILQELGFGTRLDVLETHENWAKVDLGFDAIPDGYVYQSYLRVVS